MPCILVVEDDAALRTMIRAMLSRLGYDVIDTGTGGEALDRLTQHHRVDAVVTDLAGSSFDGMQLTRVLGCHYPNLPIIVISARAQLRPKGFNDGAHSSLPKPFTLEQLRATLRRVLPG